ncbi:MAG TPA: hypothetical protein VFE35_10285 [Candidatus Cybelea sp.]|jgi:hypothetical protein|nr:hypothetical protein [Candidatus Cybelea sp.]
MLLFSFGRHAFGAGLAIALLAGCGGESQAPSAAMPPAVGPAARLTDQHLLYIADAGSHAVTVYAYPTGIFLGQLAGPTQPRGECAHNARYERNSAVLVTDATSKIGLYPINEILPHETLNDAGEQPMGCAVNPINGDLAVTSYASASGSGDIAIYRKEQRGPRYFRVPEVYVDKAIAHFYYCGYDAKGNLYVDGTNHAGRFIFARLILESKQWRTITLSQRIQIPGGVQWDGEYMAVGDAGLSPSVIYRFQIRGDSGTKVGSAVLLKSIAVQQFFIDGDVVIGPDKGAGNVGLWRYPQGGTPNALWSTFFLDQPVGAVVASLK